MMQTKRIARGGDRSRGVAMGVLGILLMSFFAILFSLGRYSLGHDDQASKIDHDPRDAAKNGVFDSNFAMQMIVPDP